MKESVIRISDQNRNLHLKKLFFLPSNQKKKKISTVTTDLFPWLCRHNQ